MKHPATQTIVDLSIIGFICQCFAHKFEGITLTQTAALDIATPEWWQYFSYMWLHGNPLHLIVNILVFTPFAKEVEAVMGGVVFGMGYIICGILCAVFVLPWMPEEGYIVGSSGAVFGVIAMYGVLFFRSHIRWLFLPRPIPVWLFLVLLVIVEVICCVVGYKNSIIHLCGMLVGLCFTLGWLLGNKVNNKKA